MQQLLIIIHILVSFALVGLVLLQHGKGADVGASFGSGASQTMFGSQGSGSFLVKVTGILAAIFFATSLSLGYLATHHLAVDKQTVDSALLNSSGTPPSSGGKNP